VKKGPKTVDSVAPGGFGWFCASTRAEMPKMSESKMNSCRLPPKHRTLSALSPSLGVGDTSKSTGVGVVPLSTYMSVHVWPVLVKNWIAAL
jgi:hypothetical protein